MKDTEKLLSEADRERREVREKYIALSRKMESLQSNEEAVRYGLQVRLCASVLHSCTRTADAADQHAEHQMLVTLRAVTNLKFFRCSWRLYVTAESSYSKCMVERHKDMVGCRRLCKTFRL